MILHELKALALREGLVDDPAFESKPVPWIIVLDEDGNYLGLRDTYQEVPLPEGKKGKPKRQAAMFSIPRRPVGKNLSKPFQPSRRYPRIRRMHPRRTDEEADRRANGQTRRKTPCFVRRRS